MAESVKEKLTVTMAPPPAALAAEKKKAAAKRSEAENLIDGHAATLKSAGALSPEAHAAQLRKHGRTAGVAGFLFFGTVALLWVLGHHGWFLRFLVWGEERKALEAAGGQALSYADAVHRLANTPWLFGATTRLVQLYSLASLATFFGLLGIAVPGLFGRVWMGFAGVLGYVNTRILLAGAYYLIITPMAILRKLSGKDPLRRGKAEGSYWIPREKQRKYDHFKRRF
ncbi:hypothetical protein HY251_07040 [bacterium]|nr:hypothetical protein [bacterium]